MKPDGKRTLSHTILKLLADPLRQLQLARLFLVSLVGVGTVGYIVLEAMTVVDALYMTIITVATVGFGEVETLSAAGRIFTMFLTCWE